MATLYLVRHGQASFGADDYDQLSALGQRQSLRLGAYFAQKGLHFDAVLTGTLRRHQQTYAGICQGMTGSAAHAVASVGAPLLWQGLNEFDSHALIATVHPEALAKPDTPELQRHHFSLLRDGLRQWMNGATRPRGMPSYPEFQQGVVGALDHIRTHCSGHVLLVSSGGPIASAIGHVLGSSHDTTIELNMRLRNSAVTEFAFNPRRYTLQTYNSLAHLDHPDHAAWVTGI